MKFVSAVLVVLWFFTFVNSVSTYSSILSPNATKIYENNTHLPVAYAGQDIITYVGNPTVFKGYGSSPDDEIIKYEWDFDNDSHFDWSSTHTSETLYTYNITGTYYAKLRVYDSNNLTSTDSIKVVVKYGTGSQEYIVETQTQTEVRQVKPLAVDGIKNRYAVMINGGAETRFWNDVTFMYSTLTNDYNFTAENIYLFNYDGKNPDGENPNDMIDYPAKKTNISNVFNELAGIVDEDDLLFVWVTDHGRGYTGPESYYGGAFYGYLDGFASVDPGDEQDYLESNFKLRSFFTGGNYRCNHGMDVWKVRYKYSSSHHAYQMYRNEYVSNFTNVYFESPNATLSDNDIYIERFVDYLLGDTNRDGYINTSGGEVYDWDGDDIQPYDHSTGTFDEDDWGSIDYYDDNVAYVNTLVPGDNYTIFDYNFDNKVDIDINYDPQNLEVDGTDLDNQGLFDGIDVNDDGDMNDWVSIDEKICLYSDDLLDDELATYLSPISAKVIPIFMEQCFSGGFIEDLSATNRVISTATVEEDVSWGNIFVGHFTSAFHWATSGGTPVDADANNNTYISFSESFNYACQNDNAEIPQYDDNGDKIGHTCPIPNGSDGNLGAITYLVANIPPTLTDGNVTPATGNINTNFNYTVTYTDAENDTPIYMNVTIDNIAYAMVAVNSSDLNYADGKKYYYNTTLVAGIHNYSFTTSDGTDTYTTATQAGPILNNLPTITQVDLLPDSPNTTATLNCTFIVTDPDVEDNLTANLTFWNGTNVYQEFNISVQNGTLAYQNITPEIQKKDEAWKCGVIPYDEKDYGNQVNSTIKTIQNSLPTIPILIAPVNYANISTQNVTFKYNSTDMDNDEITYFIYINDIFNKSTTSNITEINFSDGNYNWSVKAGDGEDNSSLSSIKFFTVDTTYPLIEFIYPTPSNNENRSYNYAYINLSINETNEDTLILNWNGTNETLSDYYKNKTGLADGVYTYYAWINDTAGNQNQTEIRTLTIDTTPPIITITYPINNTNFNIFHKDINVTGFVTDNIMVTNMGYGHSYESGGGGGWGPLTNPSANVSFNYTINLYEGTNIISIAAGDAAGNNVSDSIAITLSSNEVARQINVTPDDITRVDAKNETDAVLELMTNASVNGTITLTASTDPAELNATSMVGLGALGKYLAINVSDNIKGNLSWAIIKMYYTQAEVDAAGLDSESITLFRFNKSEGTWVSLTEEMDWVYGVGREDDSEPYYIWANVSHFSVYGAGVQYKPDLTLDSSDIAFSNSNPTEGDSITISATVHNTNETDANNFKVEFLVDGVSQANNTLTVKANSENTTQFTWSSVQGTHNITIIADAADAIDELDETNNDATKEITVQAKPSPPPSGGGGGGGGGGRISPIAEGVSIVTPDLMKDIIKNLDLEYKFYYDAPKTLATVLITVNEYPAVAPEVATILQRPISSLSGDVYEITVTKITGKYRFANTLIIARGDIPVDSMTTVGYAVAKRLPILLTGSKKIPESIFSTIKDLNPKEIIIVGGPVAISREVEDELSNIAEVERIWGETRYETSVEMANSLASYYKYFDTIVITDGNNPSTDAVIVASGYKAPLLYVRGNEIPQDVRTFLKEHKKEYFGRQMKVLTIGVSEEVGAEIENLMVIE